jgi:hypothetical protein
MTLRILRPAVRIITIPKKSGTYICNAHKTFLCDYQNRDWAFGEAGGGGVWETDSPLSEERAVCVPHPFISNHFTIAIKQAISELLEV